MQIFSNIAKGTLTAPLPVGLTSVSLSSSDANSFPTNLSVDNYLICVIRQGTTFEVVRAVGKIGSSILIQRSQEDTIEQSFSTGATIKAEITAGVMASLVQKSEQSGFIKNETFQSTFGQIVFDLQEGTYTPGQNTLSVIINGVVQDKSTYLETSSTSFTLRTALFKNEVVTVVYYYTNFTQYGTTYSITHVQDSNVRISLHSYLKSLEERIRELESKV